MNPNELEQRWLNGDMRMRSIPLSMPAELERDLRDFAKENHKGKLSPAARELIRRGLARLKAFGEL